MKLTKAPKTQPTMLKKLRSYPSTKLLVKITSQQAQQAAEASYGGAATQTELSVDDGSLSSLQMPRLR